MAISAWLTFEKLKDLQTQVDNFTVGVNYLSVNSVGALPLALSPNSIALGQGANAANGDGNIAFGFNSSASGTQQSYAFGRGSAAGTNAICIGNGSATSDSVVIGRNGSTTGFNSVVYGNLSTAAFEGTALGHNTTASTSASAFGYNATANGLNSIQLGDGTNSTATTLQYRTVPIANGTGLIIPGPFADDTAAAGGGVGIGNPYYLPGGSLVVRLT